jgi:hypothetical protein
MIRGPLSDRPLVSYICHDHRYMATTGQESLVSVPVLGRSTPTAEPTLRLGFRVISWQHS